MPVVLVSPLLRVALEALEHAIQHVDLVADKDARLAVLSSDNAIELPLNEEARLSSIRIIDRTGRSPGYYECIKLLQDKGVDILDRSPRTEIDIYPRLANTYVVE